jgi:hypothetical protein
MRLPIDVFLGVAASAAIITSAIAGDLNRAAVTYPLRDKIEWKQAFGRVQQVILAGEVGTGPVRSRQNGADSSRPFVTHFGKQLHSDGAKDVDGAPDHRRRTRHLHTGGRQVGEQKCRSSISASSSSPI